MKNLNYLYGWVRYSEMTKSHMWPTCLKTKRNLLHFPNTFQKVLFYKNVHNKCQKYFFSKAGTPLYPTSYTAKFQYVPINIIMNTITSIKTCEHMLWTWTKCLYLYAKYLHILIDQITQEDTIVSTKSKYLINRYKCDISSVVAWKGSECFHLAPLLQRM